MLAVIRDFWNTAAWSLTSQVQRYRVRKAQNELQEASINRAIERVVDGTNPKIRAVTGYRGKLRPYMQRALDHAAHVARSIPGPLYFRRRAWAEDSAVNAFFSGVDELHRTFSRNADLRNLYGQNPDLTEAFLLLTMQRKETDTFGTEVEGAMLKRDVRQVTVAFSDHQVDMPSASEEELREKLKYRAFDVLVCRALQQISAYEARTRELETTLSKLKTKQRLFDMRSASLETAMINLETCADEVKDIAAQIEETEQALLAARAEFYTLEDAIDVIKDVFGHPEQYVELTSYCAHLNRLNVRTDEAGEGRGQEVCLSELKLCHDLQRVVVNARYPRDEVLPEGLCLQEAERYLL